MTFLQKLLSPVTRNLSLLPSRTLVTQPHNVAVKQQMKLFQHMTNKLTFNTSLLSRCMASLKSMHNSGPRWRTKKKMGGKMLNGNPQQRGVVLRVIVKKPKKPNSANRKCVRIRLTNGTECTAYIPGEGHNLQEHSIVLVRGGRLQDVPGVKVKCIRGKYDLAHVKK